jgi:hypothetical protein
MAMALLMNSLLLTRWNALSIVLALRVRGWKFWCWILLLA